MEDFKEIFFKNIHIIFAEASYKKFFPRNAGNAIVQNFPTKKNYSKIYIPSSKPNKRPKFVYLGTITEDRGAIKVIRCLKNAFAEGAYELHFIGDIPNKSFEKKFQKKIKENPNIFYHGFVGGDEKMKICQMCDVGLAILDPKENYVESYPTKVFEYIVCGLPVITSKFDGAM